MQGRDYVAATVVGFVVGLVVTGLLTLGQLLFSRFELAAPPTLVGWPLVIGLLIWLVLTLTIIAFETEVCGSR